eukprot:750531-Pleurochrysis_carterae.AAC.2
MLRSQTLRAGSGFASPPEMASGAGLLVCCTRKSTSVNATPASTKHRRIQRTLKAGRTSVQRQLAASASPWNCASCCNSST